MTERKTHLIGEVETVALAIDGSDFNNGAVQEAIFLCKACGAKLIVVHVIAIDSGAATQVHSSSSFMRTVTKTYISNIFKMANNSGIDSELIIEDSYQPDKTIVEIAHKHEADVIIMGRHGKKGLLNLLVGSMTAKVIGRRFPQVLVVPKDFTIGGKKILLATDGSESILAAAEEIKSLSLHCSAPEEIYVLSVATKEPGIEAARQRADTMCERMKEKGTDNITYIPMAAVGRPSEVIAATAMEKDIDMIIIGGHGTGLGKLLMGHVTEKVIGRAHCAVLVLEKKK